ncbi:MAG TPA: VOC family protein [Candidatus Binatia bacterium]|jgi:catechol 2,3-dioxygenase-like lactoylglutathione lyase family enzyme
MFAKLKHVAIVSDQYTLLGRFYEGMFGMKPSQNARPFGAVVVRDGYVGMNINPRKGKAGRQAGLDHFGFEVEDMDTVYDRLKKDYPSIKVLKRPSTRPFAGVSTHDPAGNVFDLSQGNMENRADAYVEADREQKRHVKHLALRAVDPAGLAKFYRTVFELAEMEKPADDPNFYLSDGKVVFVIMPWDIMDFAGTGIERPALDHIGFKVESVAALKSELEKVKRERAVMTPNPTGADAGPEGEARLKLFAKCPLGQFHMADPDGVLIDVTDR